MTRTCKCGRQFTWSDLGEFARQTCDRILAGKGQSPLRIECPECRALKQLPLLKGVRR